MSWPQASTLRSEIEEIKGFFLRAYAPHCLIGRCTLNIRLLNHLVDSLKKFGSISVLGAGLFGNFNLFIRRSNRMTSPRLSTGMDKTAQNKEKALHGVGSAQNEVNASRGGAATLNKRQSLE